MVTISPSILSADFARLGEDCRAAGDAGADMLHIDVMDGVFVPNISFAMPVIASLRKVSDMFFDVHTMILRPQKFIGPLADAGADLINFHYEAEGDPSETLEMICARGLKTGMTVKPGTPGEKLFPYLDRLDLVLVMTVEPGFGGQKFRGDMMDKVRCLRREADRIGRSGLILQVDGGINTETAEIAAAAGANSFVAGSSVFGMPDYSARISGIRAAAERGAAAYRP